MGTPKRFNELKVWEDAQLLAVDVYRLSSAIKDRSFNDQMKRAAVSVSNNIAEGFERGSDIDFARFLDIARGSCGEVRSMLLLASKLGFLDSQIAEPVVENTVGISRQLSAFSKYLRNKAH